MTSNSLSRSRAASSSALLLQILERPGLVAAVRDLPAPVLGKLIERIGLEDAGELVALATTAQLERIFDDDLWHADRPAGDETFRPERFALWLRVMLEAGDDVLVQRLSELPEDLLALAVHRLVLVLDTDVVQEQLSFGDEEAEALERALDTSIIEEWEEFRLLARDADVWDDVWGALMSLDRDHHDRLRAILERCCEMSTEYISGQGGLFQVLTADEMLDSDVAAARDDRRVAEGFVSPADARAFLELARRGSGGDARDPITRAYFRALETSEMPKQHRPEASNPAKSMNELAALLREADVLAPPPAQPLAALTDGSVPKAHLVAPAFEQAMTDLRQREPGLFSVRMQELGYLVNVWIAGGTYEGRRPRPVEAMEVVLRTCEAGMRAILAVERVTPEQALATLQATPADTLFRRGSSPR
ncbi:MAG: DUF6178 family protein [Polyangia bacterium]